MWGVAGTEVRRTLTFHRTLRCLNLCDIYSGGPTGIQPRWATCRLGFRKDLSRERQADGGLQAGQGVANLGGQLPLL